MLGAEEIVSRSAVELAADVRHGRLSAVEVLDAHVERIEAVNPAVNAIADMNVDLARERAKRTDELPAHQRAKLRLAGLPSGAKDLIPAEGFRHTQGSTLFADRIAVRDHVVVSRMRAAGVTMLGTTNTPEFGLGSHTFNGVYGLTRNPYDLSRSAGGSSGGAAAALAARMLPIADGSDTGGSLRNPASFCNVVGLRPSLGQVPNSPNGYPYGTLSVKGPMARSVRDVALLMSCMVGRDASDPLSATDEPATYAAVSESPHGSRLGKDTLRAAWSPTLGDTVPVAAEVLDVLQPVVSKLSDAGMDVHLDQPNLDGAKEAFRALRGIQMLAALGPLEAQHRDQMKEDALWNIAAGRATTPEQVAQAGRDQGTVFRRTAEFLEEYDILITPTCQVAPFPADQRYPRAVNGQRMNDYLEWMTLPSVITVTSHPAISVPVGFTAEGHPVGLQIIGRHRGDAQVLEYAKRIEDLFGTGGVAPAEDLSRPQDRFLAIA